MRQWIIALPTPARLVVSALLLMLLLLLVAALSFLLGWLSDNLGAIDKAEPQIARLAGYLSAESQLVEIAEEVESQNTRLAFPGDLELSQAGAQMQQQLRAFGENAGMVISGSQLVQKAADPEQEEQFDRLVVELSMRGEPSALDEFLAQVYRAQPLMFVDSLKISKVRMSNRERRRLQSEGTLNESELLVFAEVRALRLAGR